jgi:hypothetical protein
MKRRTLTQASALFAATLLSGAPPWLTPLQAQTRVEPVGAGEIDEIRQAFRSLNLAKAEIARDDDGRIRLVGEYDDRDQVELAFAAARAVVGLRRVAPTTPGYIKNRLQNFDNSMSSVVANMLKKAPAAPPATPTAAANNAGNIAGNSKLPPATAATAAAQAALASLPPGQNTWGLILGVGKYKSLPSHNLPGADKDAKDFYNFLVAPAGGALRYETIQLLTQEQAHSQAVKAAMRRIMELAKAGDSVVLFVAAHGLPNALGNFDIVLYDTAFPKSRAGSKKESLEFVITDRKTALSDEDLKSFIAQLTLKDVRTVMVLDTCYSGKTFAVVPGYLPSRTRSLSQHKKEAEYSTSLSQDAISELAQRAKDAKTSRIVIVSASEDEESLEADSQGGGAFTQNYIKSLNSIHDFADAFDRTKPTVIRFARTQGQSQTPRMLVVPEQANTKL